MAQKEGSISTIATKQCEVHGHNPIDRYCKQHHVVGCSQCMVDQHSDCDKICLSDNKDINQKLLLPTEEVPLGSTIDEPKTIPKAFTSGPLIQRSPKLLDIKRNSKIRNSVRLISDLVKCNIYSACTLGNGTVVLVDNNNSNLKCLDSFTYTFRDSCDLPRWPWQVCAISSRRVAVCCANHIQFVSVSGNGMRKTNRISTDFFCIGLAYANVNLFVSDRKTSIYVYKLAGVVLRKFFGDNLYSAIRCLAVSSENSNVYVTDLNEGLIILDMNGSLVRKIGGPHYPELSGAHGLCRLKNDSVLVCGRNSRNYVSQFDLDGLNTDELLRTYDNSQAICLSKNNRKLILGFYNSDEIEVYDVI